MSFDSFSLLSPRIRRMMIIHSGESTQVNNTQPSALRPLFLAMLAGMWIQKSHNTTKMATDTMINAASVICRYKLFLVIISANVQKIRKVLRYRRRGGGGGGETFAGAHPSGWRRHIVVGTGLRLDRATASEKTHGENVFSKFY